MVRSVRRTIALILLSFIILIIIFYIFIRPIGPLLPKNTVHQRNGRNHHFWVTKYAYSTCVKSISKLKSKGHSTRTISDPMVIILVDSKADDYESRCAIRTTWSHYAVKNPSVPYVVYFQLAYKDEDTLKRVQYENQLYQDLLIFNHIIERYQNVGLKLMESFRYIQKRHNPSLKFIIKTDDDVYVNINEYLTHLNNDLIASNVDYEGYLNRYADVIQDKDNKNYQPSLPILGRFFPPFCVGFGYMLKATKVDCLIWASETHENLQNGDTNVGYLLQFCNTTMQNNINYKVEMSRNSNLYGGIELIKDRKPFYFMHGIRKYDQIKFDTYIYYQRNNN